MAENKSFQINGDPVGAILIGLIFLFVWPGPLRYQYRFMPDMHVMIRIDKLNGNIWALEDGKFGNKVTSIENGSVNWSKPNEKH